MNTDGFSRDFSFLEGFGTQTLFLKWQLCFFNYKSPQLVSKCISWKPSLKHVLFLSMPLPVTIGSTHRQCFLFGRHLSKFISKDIFLNKCEASRHNPQIEYYFPFYLWKHSSISSSAVGLLKTLYFAGSFESDMTFLLDCVSLLFGILQPARAAPREQHFKTLTLDC